VIFDDENLAYGKQIAKKFKEVGIDDASFGFNCGFLETHRYFDDVETIANRRHIELLPPSEQTIQANALEPSDYSTFMQYELPERAFIISPIISEQGLVMLHAPRGIGKTHVALGIAMAVATGSSFLRWHAPKPKRVLYLDGEMPATMMRSRLKAITAGLGKVPGDGYFRLLNPDLIDASMPDIGTEEGQAGLDEYLHGIELLVIDNLSTLCRSGRENESESWEPIQSWLLNLRRRGIAVLIVHHSGKNGNQRGTSRREDVLDTVLKLKRPEVYNQSQGARFQIHVEKGRNLFGSDAEPFEVQLREQNGEYHWEIVEMSDTLNGEVLAMLQSGKSVREIEARFGISKSRVGRMRQEFEEKGLI